MWARKITAVSLFLTQLGCVPNAAIYYRPSMEGGHILARRCVPTESIVEFGALPMQASVIEGHRAWEIALGLRPMKTLQPTWQTFHFATSDFYVRDLVSGITTNSLPISVLRDDKSSSAIEPYRMAGRGQGLFTIYVELPGRPPERFEFLLPPLLIDGKEVRFPPIRFERKVWTGISPFNC